jgi:transcriptional regulator with XRE-family HTH domain
MDEREARARAMRRFRIERGWSLAQVGERSGLAASNVSRAENGLRRPFTIEVICGVFGVTRAEVLAACPACGYAPDAGFACLRCGTENRPVRDWAGPS